MSIYATFFSLEAHESDAIYEKSEEDIRTELYDHHCDFIRISVGLDDEQSQPVTLLLDGVQVAELHRKLGEWLDIESRVDLIG